MEFKGTKGKLFHTDNGDGTMAIVSEKLMAIAFLPKRHPDTKENIKLFEAAPEMFELLKKIRDEKVSEHYFKIEKLLTKITK